MPPAARATDNHICTMADPPVPTPHVGGPIKPPCSTTVKTNNLAQARATDQLQCTGSPAPDFIVTGSTTVLIDNLMAARQTDKTMHAPPGNIATGSPDVLIGGPTGGATLGNPTAGNTTCQLAAAGRNPPPGASPFPGGTPNQNYNNCGLESSRQVINRANRTEGTPAAITQEGFMNNPNTQYSGARGPALANGGTVPAQLATNLTNNGVPATANTPPNMTTLQQGVAERRGVIVSVWASNYWPNATLANMNPPLVPGSNTGGHAVLVTGVQYDAAGNPLNVIINDTGTGNCMQSIPAATFQGAMIGGGNNHVVTTNPIW